MIWFFFWAVVGALIGASAAQRRGFNTMAGAVSGLLLGPFAFVLYFVSGVLRPNEGRKCPFCAEWIKSEATVCKHCHREVPPNVTMR